MKRSDLEWEVMKHLAGSLIIHPAIFQVTPQPISGNLGINLNTTLLSAMAREGAKKLVDDWLEQSGKQDAALENGLVK